jgi:hypothetical protein
MAKLEKIEETMKRQMKCLMMAKWNTHQEMTEIDPDTEIMQSVEELQEVPRENAIVKSVKGWKKWHRGWKSTQRAKGTDLRILWILEDVGCRLQEGVPSCSSGRDSCYAMTQYTRFNNGGGDVFCVVSAEVI